MAAGAHRVRRGSWLGNRKKWEKEGGSSQSPDGSARHVVVLGRGEARLPGRRSESGKQGLDAAREVGKLSPGGGLGCGGLGVVGLECCVGGIWEGTFG